MAKRMTDTDKWKKGFFRSLPGAYKLLWQYLCDECDHAGIWEVDREIAQIKIGIDMQIDWDIALELFQTKVLVFAHGEKWFIPSFITFQYKELKGTDRATNSVVTQLKKYNLISDDLEIIKINYIAPSKGLTSPKLGCKDKDKDKDIEEDKVDKEGLREKKEKKEKQPKEEKIMVAPEVTLTIPENDRLTEEFGREFMSRVYNWYANYKIEKGYKTKSDNLSIRRWVIDAVKKQTNGFNANSISNQPSTSEKLGTSAARMEALRNW